MVANIDGGATPPSSNLEEPEAPQRLHLRRHGSGRRVDLGFHFFFSSFSFLFLFLFVEGGEGVGQSDPVTPAVRLARTWVPKQTYMDGPTSATVKKRRHGGRRRRQSPGGSRRHSSVLNDPRSRVWIIPIKGSVDVEAGDVVSDLSIC